MTGKPSRPVTRARCVTCGQKFTATRRDARYCSGRCRQLVRRYAEALGITESQVLTGEAQFVDEAGNVYIRGEFTGHTTRPAHGGAAWGLEAAGPPYSPPTEWMHQEFGPECVRTDERYRQALQGIGKRAAERGTPAAACHGPQPLPDGAPGAPPGERVFATVTADPPWRYGNTSSRGAAEDHYPTMAIEDLSGLLDSVTARDGSEGS